VNLPPTAPDSPSTPCRLLDDNRELFVPELHEVVKPHPHFMLFATQNPAGAYAGRKFMSRAFRSRFLELHVGDIPDSELAHILHERCAIAPSHADKLVAVMKELQRWRQVLESAKSLFFLTSSHIESLRTCIRPVCTISRSSSRCSNTGLYRQHIVLWRCVYLLPDSTSCSRANNCKVGFLGVAMQWLTHLLPQGSNVFAGKHGLITPRDLFKWANRGAVTYHQLAENGYMLLGERLRSDAERSVVQKALESVMNVQVSQLLSMGSWCPHQ